MTRGCKSDKTLVVPPKKWRSAASLRGYAGQLKSAIEAYERTIPLADGGDETFIGVELHAATAKALLEIVCQAIHTEQDCGS